MWYVLVARANITPQPQTVVALPFGRLGLAPVPAPSRTGPRPAAGEVDDPGTRTVTNPPPRAPGRYAPGLAVHNVPDE